MYAGYGNERCRVLCTVELGLAFRRKLPQEEQREVDSVDGDGVPLSRPTSSASKVVPSTPGGEDGGRISRAVSVGSVGSRGSGRERGVVGLYPFSLFSPFGRISRWVYAHICVRRTFVWLGDALAELGCVALDHSTGRGRCRLL